MGSCFIVSGSRHLQTRLVEPSAKSLNSGDVFVLVTPKVVHLWNGTDANVMKKAKVRLPCCCPCPVFTSKHAFCFWVSFSLQQKKVF